MDTAAVQEAANEATASGEMLADLVQFLVIECDNEVLQFYTPEQVTEGLRAAVERWRRSRDALQSALSS